MQGIDGSYGNEQVRTSDSFYLDNSDHGQISLPI